MRKVYLLKMNKILKSCRTSLSSSLNSGRLDKEEQDVYESESPSDQGEATPDRHESRASLNENLLAKHHMGWRRVVYNFTPAWFSVVMGTGMVSTILYTLPYNGRWLYWISVVIFAINIGIFAACCLLSFLRYTIYPETFKNMLTQPAQFMFLSTIPLGLATIVNMICYVCVPVWGQWVEELAWALWILDASLSILSALCLPFSLMSPDVDAQLSSMTAIWLLPIVTCVVTSGTGAIVADVLSNIEHALWTIVASYVLWGVGICLAMMVYVIYFQRLTAHKLPHKGVIMSVFLPMGPLGSGSFGAMKLAEAAKAVFSITHTFRDSSAASIVYVFGAMTALILWAFGLPWLFFAFASIVKSGRFPFNIGWWAFTFPVGAYAMGTCQLGRELPSAFFRVLGTILSLVVVFHWAVVSVGTLGEIFTGSFFIVPGPGEIIRKQGRGNDPEDIA